MLVAACNTNRERAWASFLIPPLVVPLPVGERRASGSQLVIHIKFEDGPARLINPAALLITTGDGRRYAPIAMSVGRLPYQPVPSVDFSRLCQMDTREPIESSAVFMTKSGTHVFLAYELSPSPDEEYTLALDPTPPGDGPVTAVHFSPGVRSCFFLWMP